MFDFLPVYKRELKAYFQSASTWVVLALFFLIVGMIYSLIFMQFSQSSMQAMQSGAMMNMFGQQNQAPNATEAIIRQVFSLVSLFIMLTIPVLSMRLLAEERSSGTFELLVTCPINDWAILIGKYLALLSVGLVIIAISALYPLLVWQFGQSEATPMPVEWPVVISCWVGLALMYAAYAGFGLMASALSGNTIIAAFVTLLGLFLWQVIGVVGSLAELSQAGWLNWVSIVANELSPLTHNENFINGVFLLKDFAFYLLATFLFLFIASKILDARRWRI